MWGWPNVRSKPGAFLYILLLGITGLVFNHNSSTLSSFLGIHICSWCINSSLYTFCTRRECSNLLAILNQEETGLPVIYVITPTYRRLVQLAELTQLAQTLLQVPSVHWIVVEDSEELSSGVTDLLQRFDTIPHTHLHGRIPELFRVNASSTPYPSRPRGASNRNRALHWIRENVKSGVVYFADDDNTYDLRLFHEMRHTRRVSMWPVGLIGIYGVSSPVVDPETGQVKEFFDGWVGDRTYAVDMASFAINVQLLHQNPDAVMPYRAGYQEDFFLKSFNLTLEDIEPRANNCTQILVWHTQNANYKSVPSFALKSRFQKTNIKQLRSQTLNLIPVA